jgi:superfamily I DNA/RNA helicase
MLASRTQRLAREVMKAVYERLGEPIPPGLDAAGRVRIMTLHSCKGLSARVVFIPGLEEEILPGPYRAQFPGQV